MRNVLLGVMIRIFIILMGQETEGYYLLFNYFQITI